MVDEIVNIGGKDYVSSARAAQLVGYTKDYVGQLAREGKVEAQRVGRAWYISEESIRKHKLGVHYTLTKPKKKPKVVKSVIDEKLNINIVKSSKQNLKHVTKSNVKSFKNDKVKLIKEDSNVSFIPKLNKKKRDVLLHSDFKYEKVDNKPLETSKKPKNNDDSHHGFKKIRIRKPQNIIKSAQNKSSQIDGIIKSSPRVKTRSKNRHSIYLERNIRKVKSPVYDDNLTEESVHEDQKVNNFKIIPIISGIVLFTIFIVIYIFISVD